LAPTGFGQEVGEKRPIEIAAHSARLQNAVNKRSPDWPLEKARDTRVCSPLGAQEPELNHESVHHLFTKIFSETNDFFLLSALGIRNSQQTAR
jgi:hypothetical protein